MLRKLADAAVSGKCGACRNRELPRHSPFASVTKRCGRVERTCCNNAEAVSAAGVVLYRRRAVHHFSGAPVAYLVWRSRLPAALEITGGEILLGTVFAAFSASRASDPRSGIRKRTLMKWPDELRSEEDEEETSDVYPRHFPLCARI